MQSEIDSLREVNSKLLTEITELRKENAEVKAENVKLKHALEEHEARFTNLEQKDKEKTTLIAKLDDDIREIKQEQNAVNISAQSNTSIVACLNLLKILRLVSARFYYKFIIVLAGFWQFQYL